MKITITINKELLIFEEKTIEVNGVGTVDDPCVIHPNLNLPDVFEIYDSNINIHIVDLNQDSLALYHCTNLTIENCTFVDLHLSRDSKILIKGVKCRDLELYESKECRIESCTIASLVSYNCYYNHFKDNEFQHFHDLYDTSKNNTFDNNTIPQKYKKKFEKAQKTQRETRNTISIHNGRSSFKLSLDDYEFICSGSGTEINPYIIGPQDHKFHSVSVSQHRSHMQFKKLINNPKFLNFNYCKHVKVEDCKFKGLIISYCDDFRLNNITASYIRIDRTSGDILIQNSTFKKIILFRFTHGNITFKNCKIDIVKKNLLSSFQFQNCIDKRDNPISN